MKRYLHVVLAALFLPAFVKAQNADTLTVYYYENYPYAYTENGKLKGIEVDIIDEYCAWMKQKGIWLVVSAKPFKEFGAFYTAVKNGSSKTIGLGSVTNNAEREKEVSFSPPYLQNVPVLITDGKVPTIKAKTSADVAKGFADLSAIVVAGSSHAQYVADLKKQFLPGLKIETAETQTQVLDKVANSKNYFGYADIVAYWSYLKKNPNKFLKMQKVFSGPKEYLGFILPKSSVYSAHLGEFFESGFGFTSTKTYHAILEKYLGYEIIESVEIK